MSENIIKDRAIALAGIVQAVKLVKQVATKGYAQETELQTCMYSILQTEVQNTEQIYGEIKNLRFGLQELQTILNVKAKNKDSDIVRYLLSVIHLEKQLSKQPQMLTHILQGLQSIKMQINENQLTDPAIITSLANIYQQTLSTLKFKIHITGNAMYLTSFDNLSKVRTLLLAAVRAAVLWSQLGGSKWHLVFKKKELLNATTNLLAQIN